MLAVSLAVGASASCGRGSHLAMRSAPGRAIQDLAGHADLATTHMHLSPAALDSAIRLLEMPSVATSVAHGSAETANSTQ